MAGKSIGTVFVELDLDPSRYTKGQQRLYKDATSTTLNIEANFKKLGLKSSAEMDLMRAKITNSFEAIKHSAQATANDIIRAERAKTEQLNRLNEQQFGKQTSFLTQLRQHWIAVAAAAYAAMRAVRAGWDLMGEAGDYKERINSLNALGKQYGMTGDYIVKSMKEASRGLLSLKEASDLAASALNLSLSPTQMIEFTRVAEALTDVIGGSIPEAYNRLVVAAASGRTMTLAQMGIIVDLDAAYKAQGRTLSEAEKQQVRLNVILDAAKAKTDALGASVDTERDKMDRFTSAIADLKLEIGKLALAFTPLIEKLTNAIQGFDMLFSSAESAKLARRRVDIISELEEVEKQLAEFPKHAIGIAWMDNFLGSEDEFHERRQRLLAELEDLSIQLNKPKEVFRGKIPGTGSPGTFQPPSKEAWKAVLADSEAKVQLWEEEARIQSAIALADIKMQQEIRDQAAKDAVTQAQEKWQQMLLDQENKIAILEENARIESVILLDQLEEERKIREAAAREEIRIEREKQDYISRVKESAIPRAIAAGQRLLVATQTQNEGLFKIFQAFSAAHAMVSAHRAAAKALAEVPWPYNWIEAAAEYAAGMAEVMAIRSAGAGAGGGASGGGSVGTYSADPYSGLPAFTSGEADKESNQRTLTINIQGDFIGDEGYIEMLAEKISGAVEDRDVRLIATSSKFAEAFA